MQPRAAQAAIVKDAFRVTRTLPASGNEFGQAAFASDEKLNASRYRLPGTIYAPDVLGNRRYSRKPLPV